MPGCGNATRTVPIPVACFLPPWMLRDTVSVGAIERWIGSMGEADSISAEVEVVAVGDLMLGDSAICTGFGFASRYTESGLEAILKELIPFLAADVTIGNLETPLSRAGLRRSQWSSVQMRGRPGYAPVLRRLGFDVLNVANNHAIQHGQRAFQETVELLTAADIAVCGLCGSGPWLSQPLRWTTASGVKLGILGYCLRPRQYSRCDPPFAEGEEETIVQDVERLRSEVGHVIVSLHWGEEFASWPSNREVRMATAIIEAGAAVVFGHHPHVLRPAVLSENRLIAYSLGNFVADMVWQERLRRGALLRCRLGPSGVVEAKVVATRIDDDFRPRLLPGVDLHTVESVEGLDAEAYQSKVAQALHAQRWAAYRYAIRRMLRYPPRMLVQLGFRTLRNRLIVTAG